MGSRNSTQVLTFMEQLTPCPSHLPVPTAISMPAHLDEATVGDFAGTVNSKHTLVFMQHIARSADTALPAGGGDLGAGAIAEALWVRAGRQTGRKAGGVEAVGRAVQSCVVEKEWH